MSFKEAKKSRCVHTPGPVEWLDTERSIRWDNSGNFLHWWLSVPRLEGDALRIFNQYYSNYRKSFRGYIKEMWADRHVELDRELETIQKNGQIRVMDLGCGTGTLALYCALKVQGKGNVLGVDINEQRLSCAEKRMRVLEQEIGFKIKCEFKKRNVLSLEENNKFDLIYLEETLHHMEPRIAVAKKISSLLKAGGVLVISETNGYNPFLQLQLLRKRRLNTIKMEVARSGETYLYGIERIMPARLVAKLFGENNLAMKSLRYFRTGSVALGKLADKRGIDFMKVDRNLAKIALFSKIFSVHYNFVFQKDRVS